MARQNDTGAESRDLAAFIALALATISETIEATVAPWEKRDYWVKADKFRMDWAWSSQYAKKIKQAVLDDDWGKVALVAGQIAQKLNKVTVPERHRMGRPWVGAWNELKKGKEEHPAEVI
jgi:hypothetical protein